MLSLEGAATLCALQMVEASIDTASATKRNHAKRIMWLPTSIQSIRQTDRTIPLA